MLNSGGSDNKPNLQCNLSAGENMISFDASRISPAHANNHLDTSHANMKNMVGQLGEGLQAWPIHKPDEDGRKANEVNRLDEDLTDPED